MNPFFITKTLFGNREPSIGHQKGNQTHKYRLVSFLDFNWIIDVEIRASTKLVDHPVSREEN